MPQFFQSGITPICRACVLQLWIDPISNCCVHCWKRSLLTRIVSKWYVLPVSVTISHRASVPICSQSWVLIQTGWRLLNILHHVSLTNMRVMWYWRSSRLFQTEKRPRICLGDINTVELFFGNNVAVDPMLTLFANLSSWPFLNVKIKEVLFYEATTARQSK